ncbi:MAG: antibiotic biosynthesis monooxygenase [Rhizobacter sp.]|nr:antibiotic biosynthesis monooxygenase [Burkholderiaceae bacterium]MCO5125342.1 antibiotic biosynthesis monooxygenase [Rhizobacter sp.]
MVHVLARITAQPASADAMRAILVKLVAQTRKESGCLQYELFQQDGAAHVFQTVERWTDGAAADAHMSTPHVAAAIAQGGAHFGAAPEILRFTQIA